MPVTGIRTTTTTTYLMPGWLRHNDGRSQILDAPAQAIPANVQRVRDPQTDSVTPEQSSFKLQHFTWLKGCAMNNCDEPQCIHL